MAEIYTFNDAERSTIDLLKHILIIKRDNYKSFKLKKERINFRKSVVLYTPKLYDENTIEAYLLKNEYAIYKLGYKCFFPKINLINDESTSILFLGKVYDVSYNNQLKSQYVLDNEKNIIYTKNNLSIPYRKLQFYDEQAKEILSQRLYLYAEKFGLFIKDIRIKNYKSLWGACYSDNTVILNKRLILAPLGTIDAIICHELAHILHPNHSKDFYNTLEKLYPTYYKDYIWLNIFMPETI